MNEVMILAELSAGYSCEHDGFKIVRAEKSMDIWTLIFEHFEREEKPSSDNSILIELIKRLEQRNSSAEIHVKSIKYISCTELEVDLEMKEGK